MPRFFFNLRDEGFLPDEEGIEFSDLEAARAAAVEGIRGIVCDQVHKGRLCLGYSMEVADEAGEPLFTMRFEEAVRCG